MHVFLSPHLDDAILSCGATIAALKQRGETVVILTVFAGDPPEGLPASPVIEARRAQAGDEREGMRQRRLEDAHAAMKLGAQVCHLPLVEAPLRTCRSSTGLIALYPTPESLFGAASPDDEARVTLFSMPFPFGHDVTCIYAPMSAGRHVDHEIVRDWALVLAGPNKAPMLKLYTGLPHGRDSGIVDKTLQYYAENFPALRLRNERVMVEEADMEKKLRALRCYGSLLDTTDMDAVEDQVRKTMLDLGNGGPAERFWQVLKENQTATQTLEMPRSL